MESSLLVDGLSALAADSHAAGLAAGYVVHVMGDPHSLVAAGANDHHIGSREGAFALGDSALDLFLGIGPGVTLDHHRVLHQHPSGSPVDAQHAPGLTLV